jgi:hypothetical protein
MPPRPASLSGRPARLLLAAGVVAVTLYAVGTTVVAAVDAEIAARGEPATGIVVEAGELRRTRTLWHAEAQLAVPRPDGTELVVWAARPLRVTGSWADPARAPRRGDRISVLVVPDTPPRVVPADAVGGRWGWIATLAFAWTLAAAAWAAAAVVLRRRKTRADG